MQFIYYTFFMRNSSSFAQRLKIFYFIACIDLYYAGCISYIYYKIVGDHLIIMYSWPYADKYYLQTCSYDIIREFIFDCIKVIYTLLLLYLLSFMLIMVKLFWLCWLG